MLTDDTPRRAQELPAGANVDRMSPTKNRGSVVTAVIEDLPFTERVNVVGDIADALVLLLQGAGGRMDLMDALRAAAIQFGTLISQIRYGLDFAISQHRVQLRDNTLSLA